MLDYKRIQQSLNLWREHIRFHLKKWHYIMFALLLVFLTALLAFDFLSAKFSLAVGQIAPRDMIAPRTVEFVDRYKTKKLEDMAMESVEKIYDFKPEAVNQVRHDIHIVYSAFLEVKNKKLTEKEQLLELEKKIPLKLSEDSMRVGLKLTNERLLELERVSRSINENIIDAGLKQEKLEDGRKKAAAEVDMLAFPLAQKKLLVEVTQGTLMPNFIVNELKTIKKKEEAKQSVQPVQTVIPKGLVIVRKGDQITQEHINLLEALGLQRTRVSYQTILGVGILNLLLLIFLLVYLIRYTPDILLKKNKLSLLLLLLAGTTFINKLMNANGINNFGTGVGIVAAGSMLTAILLNQRLAIMLSALLAFYMGLMHSNDVGVFLMAFSGGLTGIYSISRLSQRDDLMKSCLRISAVNVLTILTIGLIYNKTWEEIGLGFIWGISYGILSTVLTIGILPFLENTFGITTSWTLLELANPNEPLLRRLMMEAPGTYQHSVIVANLAEAAAERIKADALLVRVGAYYHDIGKLNRPCFFIENQFSEDNPHDNISPGLSAMIIISHVKDGILTAREHHLPEIVRDIITQHHGTTLVSYFYHKAAEQDGSAEESDFRYPGPKPQTREAAVVMMADSVEAAVRSLPKLTPEKMESMVKKIVNDKLHSGQLDECALTFRDLDIITNAFIHVLGGIFHSRIEYPEIEKEVEKS